MKVGLLCTDPDISCYFIFLHLKINHYFSNTNQLNSNVSYDPLCNHDWYQNTQWVQPYDFAHSFKQYYLFSNNQGFKLVHTNIFIVTLNRAKQCYQKNLVKLTIPVSASIQEKSAKLNAELLGGSLSSKYSSWYLKLDGNIRQSWPMV